MTWFYATLWLAGAWPLARAWLRRRGSSLEHALLWLGAAWVAWGAVSLLEDPERPGWAPGRFVALALTCCPVVAVLGARRPYVGAWNFVVLGLCAVLLLPLLEMAVLGSHTLDTLRLFFLGATLAIGVINYLPTRFGLGALWIGVCLALEFWLLAAPERVPDGWRPEWTRLALLLSPWLAWLASWRKHEAVTAFDRRWRTFRDSYGLVWGQRAREQFNRAAANAGWNATLTWRGLRASGLAEAQALDVLNGLLQRFLERHG
ncbi:MAG: hypothetical protein U0793_07160 [Gemmataceae bacterium]